MLRDTVVRWYSRILFHDLYLMNQLDRNDDWFTLAPRVLHLAVSFLDMLINATCGTQQAREKWFNLNNFVCLAGASLVMAFKRLDPILSEKLVENAVNKVIARDFDAKRKKCEMKMLMQRFRDVVR